MLDKISIRNFGPLPAIEWSAPSPEINVLIGENATGKTFLLKALYVAVRSTEEFQRGSDKRLFRQVVDNKIHWTFQAERFGDLVTKGQSRKLHFSARLEKRNIEFGFGSSAGKGVGTASETMTRRDTISLFLPAKEVLSLFHVIKKSRGIDQEFGFDDTYYDLVKALDKAPTMGKNFKEFAQVRTELNKFLDGQLVFSGGDWKFKASNNALHSIHLTAEGFKRISLLSWLLGNRTLSKRSILFIDEPEAVLHPQAIIMFMEMLGLLAKSGVQVFLATHSYYVLKKLHLMAKSGKADVQVLSLSTAGQQFSDLAEGMPQNSIIAASVKLYDEEFED